MNAKQAGQAPRKIAFQPNVVVVAAVDFVEIFSGINDVTSRLIMWTAPLT